MLPAIGTHVTSAGPAQLRHVHNASLIQITEGVADLLGPGTREMTCPGITVDWPAGSHWSNYPWLQHDNRDLGWEPISFEADGRITFRSDTCKPSSTTGAPCRACQMLPDSALFCRMIETAKEALPHTPWEYLTAKQMQDSLKRLAQRNKVLTTQVGHFVLVSDSGSDSVWVGE